MRKAARRSCELANPAQVRQIASQTGVLLCRMRFVAGRGRRGRGSVAEMLLAVAPKPAAVAQEPGAETRRSGAETQLPVARAQNRRGRLTIVSRPPNVAPRGLEPRFKV